VPSSKAKSTSQPVRGYENYNSGLPANRSQCPDCRGKPSCKTCSGTGEVCPGCQGMRWVRQEWESGEDPKPVVPCTGCMVRNGDHWILDRMKEARNITRYLEQQTRG
jgi:hypothetical protein